MQWPPQLPSLAAMLLALVLPQSASGRIGETFEEIKVRFGEGEKQESNRLPGSDKYYFVKNGFGIEVMIVDGRSVMEIYHRVNGKITDAEIQELLRLNDDLRHWRFSKKDNQWKRDDKKLVAFRQPGHPDFFFIQDVAAVKSAPKDNKAKAKEKMDGF